MKIEKVVSICVSALLCVLFCIAIFGNPPYDFYGHLRTAFACGTLAIVYIGFREARKWWPTYLGLVVLVSVHLILKTTREEWLKYNIASIVLLLISSFALCFETREAPPYDGEIPFDDENEDVESTGVIRRYHLLIAPIIFAIGSYFVYSAPIVRAPQSDYEFARTYHEHIHGLGKLAENIDSQLDACEVFQTTETDEGDFETVDELATFKKLSEKARELDTEIGYSISKTGVSINWLSGITDSAYKPQATLGLNEANKLYAELEGTRKALAKVIGEQSMSDWANRPSLYFDSPQIVFKSLDGAVNSTIAGEKVLNAVTLSENLPKLFSTLIIIFGYTALFSFIAAIAVGSIYESLPGCLPAVIALLVLTIGAIWVGIITAGLIHIQATAILADNRSWFFVPTGFFFAVYLVVTGYARVCDEYQENLTLSSICLWTVIAMFASYVIAMISHRIIF